MHCPSHGAGIAPRLGQKVTGFFSRTTKSCGSSEPILEGRSLGLDDCCAQSSGKREARACRHHSMLARLQSLLFVAIKLDTVRAPILTMVGTKNSTNNIFESWSFSGRTVLK